MYCYCYCYLLLLILLLSLLFYCKAVRGYNNHVPCSKTSISFILLDNPLPLQLNAIIVDELTLVSDIFLMVNSGKGNTESYLIDSGLPGAGTNVFSGQYTYEIVHHFITDNPYLSP